MKEDEVEFPPTLHNIISQKSLRWIFVGGKGGVGKTTCSCALAILLSRSRKKILLVSTDPAHSISDAFDQQFNDTPILVNGFKSLYAMEIGHGKEHVFSSLKENISSILESTLSSVPGFFLNYFKFVLGIDEAMSFSLLLNSVDEMNFDTVVFDTAPTGHTLRLLSLPKTVNTFFGKIDKISGLLQIVFS
jgi:arsenite-transporting ATPase